MPRVTVDRDQLVAIVGCDAGYYPFAYRAYVNTGTGGLEILYDEDDDGYSDLGVPPEQNAELRCAIESNPDRHLEIPLPDHGQQHEWFVAFLEERDAGGEYFRSIGGWLKQHASEEDRIDWHDTQAECAIELACRVAAEADIELVVS